MPNDMEMLLQIQSIDDQLAESSARVNRLERDQTRLQQKMVEEEQAIARQGEELQRAEHESLMLNLQVDELDATIRAYQHRLDTGIISFKEMEDLQAKIVSERSRISRMEDDALERIDAVAQQKLDLAASKAALQQRQKELAQAVTGVREEIQTEQRRSESLQAQRAEVAAAMSEFALAQYALLRRKLASVVVPIEHGTCSGCKLRLSGSTLERVRGSSDLVVCEHCSRILYTG